MRNFINTKALLIISMILIVSCNDDFLDRIPMDSLSEESFFNSANDLKTYVNNFYDNLPAYYGWSANGLDKDVETDILLTYPAPKNSSINRKASSAIAPLNSSEWNNQYENIRGINLFMKNYHKVSRNPASNHYIGEGYFWRAWFYFNLLTDFGDVPIILHTLNISDEKELYRPRDSRYDVARQIIQDLDSAIFNLQWKGKGAASQGRINKEAALVMKARVALFEGSWEYYHNARNTPFKVPGKDGKDFLQLIEPAVQDLIGHQGTKIFRKGGIFNEPYNQLTAQKDGSATDGVFLYRVYDTGLVSQSNNFYSKITENMYMLTKRLVDLYLDADGIPQELSNRPLETMIDWGQNLDPRMRQTIWTPDRGPLGKLPNRTGSDQDVNLRYPIPTFVYSNSYNPTGIRNFKGAIFEDCFRNTDYDDVIIRYGEGLLALAEAKAILGTITQEDLNKTVNLLRSRVNMAEMNLQQVKSWNITYSSAEGFDPTATNIVNEIRRERTIELATEGFRKNDLKRWAVYDNVINGYKPKGAPLQEFMDYFNNKEAMANDSWTFPVDLTLKKGKNIDSFSDGFINPFWQTSQFKENGDGFYINEDRDYLNAIPEGQIILYEQYGVTLTQNPGWQ